MNASVNWASYEMPVPDPRSGFILRPFPWILAWSRAGFLLRRGYRADEPSGPLLLHTARSSCRGRGSRPIPSRSPVWRFLVDRLHYLSNILPGSAKMAQDPQVGRTNTL